MCDCVSSTLLHFCNGTGVTNLGFVRCNPPYIIDYYSTSSAFGEGRLRLVPHKHSEKSTISFRRLSLNSSSNDYYGCSNRSKRQTQTQFENHQGIANSSNWENGVDDVDTQTPTLDFLEFDDKKSDDGSVKEDDLLKIRGSGVGDAAGLSLGELEVSRQSLKRSNLIAKQVISVQSAITLGFVSQLWVDTNSWVVLVLEVRPNLLSGDMERFLLDDVTQVGDVVLIQDESVIENEFRMFGLETLVGYNVVTPGRRNIGKVRGFTFNINSGAVESLELDSFGISIIPSSLVSTYALFVGDVLEVVSDTVVVDEAAATHIQRITKGFWDAQNVGNSIQELGEYSDLERQPIGTDEKGNRRRSFTGRKLRRKMRDTMDDWEPPMDYL